METIARWARDEEQDSSKSPKDMDPSLFLDSTDVMEEHDRADLVEPQTIIFIDIGEGGYRRDCPAIIRGRQSVQMPRSDRVRTVSNPPRRWPPRTTRLRSSTKSCSSVKMLLRKTQKGIQQQRKISFADSPYKERVGVLQGLSDSLPESEDAFMSTQRMWSQSELDAYRVKQQAVWLRDRQRLRAEHRVADAVKEDCARVSGAMS